MKLAFLYAGQGSQRTGMGQDLYEKYPEFAETIDNIHPGFDLKKLLFETPDAELSQTRNTQPALAAFAAGVTAVLYAHGIRPELAAGLSLGEYSALHAAGVFDARTLISLTAFRGAEMEKAAAGNDCTMCAIIGLEAPVVEEVCRKACEAGKGKVEVANYNTKNQIVVAGLRDAVEQAAALAKEAGARKCTLLNVSSAFHTSFMAPASDALHVYFKNLTFGDMQFPVIFNSTARPLEEGKTIPEMLELQVKSSVRMSDTIEYLAEQGVDTIIEIGPGKVLSGFVRKTVRGIKTMNIDDVAGMEAVLEAMGG